jgi:hypothetical protein
MLRTPYQDQFGNNQEAIQMAIENELFHCLGGIELPEQNQFHIVRLQSHEPVQGAIRGAPGNGPRGTPGDGRPD